MVKKTIILTVLAAILICVGILFLFKLDIYPFGENAKIVNNNAPEENQEGVSLIISNGNGQLMNFTLDFKEGATAFDLLEAVAEKSGIILEIKNYDSGIFVETIDGLENGQEGKYWLYYVNGEMPQVSADKKELKAGDKVEFKFEKSPF